MPGNKLLSICCLGYRHALFIRDCITTIWQDPWPEKEIIAMDDGSGDGSVELLKKLQIESPCPFTVFEQENTGNVPENFNRLFKASKGEAVVFTSLDDMQIPGSLEARMERLLMDGNCAFAAHTMGFAIEGEKLKPEKTPLAGKCPSVDGILEMERTQLHSFYIQGAAFRREAVQAVGGFSSNMLGDDIVLRTKILFWLQAHPQKTFALLDEPGFIYRRHAGNVSANVMRQLKIGFEYCDRFWHGNYPEMLKCWLLTGLDELPYEEALKVFRLSPGASAFLADPDVQKALRINAVKSFVMEQTNKRQEGAV